MKFITERALQKLITNLQVFGKSQFIMAFMMRTAVENLSTQERYDEIEEFFNTHDAGTGKQVYLYT